MLDRSEVMNARFMGIVTARTPEVDLGRIGLVSWQAFAVRQAQGNSEWLIAKAGGTVSAVYVMSGGPPCATAPAAAACGATP